MIKKFLIILLLIIIAFYVISSDNVKVILTGIAIFLIGMYFMEDGFKLFSGGTLEKILENLTSSNLKSLFTGFFTTSIVQSSSLISVIVISFLSVELISLVKALCIIFGANLGSTTTAWLVSYFGLKLNISLYAMPMIIFGVIFRFSKSRAFIGMGNIFLGLGFIFLGISYMKEGFETLSSSINLADYSIGGYLGILVYILIGALMTIVIQSSSATMAIIITALASGNILYIDSLALAIGANVGTTVTAVLGSLTSNQNGKRLAFGHFIFNITTAIFAVALIFILKDMIDYIFTILKLDEENYSMKLALFHTIFNTLGILILFPFVEQIARYSKKVISDEKVKKASKPIYLDKANLKIPFNAMISIQKEVIHLYTNTQKAILHALSVHRSALKTKDDIEMIINNPFTNIDTNLDEIYKNDIKLLFSHIIEYALLSQEGMNKEQNEYVSKLKLASNLLIQALKDTRDLQKNMNLYLKNKNEYIKKEYLDIKKELITSIFEVNQFIENPELSKEEILKSIEKSKIRVENMNQNINSQIDYLIRKELITSKMTSSLINDSTTAYTICNNLILIASILFVKEETIKVEETL